MRLEPRSLVGLCICALLQAGVVGHLCAEPGDREKQRALNEEVREKLRQEVSLDVIETPFSDVCKELSNLLEVTLILDPEGLEESGVTADQLVTLNLKKPGDVIFRVLLGPLHLRPVVRDGLLIITGEEKYDNTFLTPRVFVVRDLLDDPATPSKPLPVWDPRHRTVAPPAVGAGKSGAMGGSSKGGFVASMGGAAGGGAPMQDVAMPPEFEPQSSADHLVSALCDMVAPKSWTHRGGHGTARVFAGVLLVRQSDENLEEIGDLLKQMRDALAEQGHEE